MSLPPAADAEARHPLPLVAVVLGLCIAGGAPGGGELTLPLGLTAAVIGALAHGLLVLPASADVAPLGANRWTGVLVWAAGGLLAIGAALLAWHTVGRILTDPVFPHHSGRMGLLVQMVEAWRSGGLVYAEPYRMASWFERMPLAPASGLPFWAVREAGLDWRFASLALAATALAGIAGLLVAAGGRRGSLMVAASVLALAALPHVGVAMFASEWTVALPLALAVGTGAAWRRPWLLMLAAGALVCVAPGYWAALVVATGLCWRWRGVDSVAAVGCGWLLPVVCGAVFFREFSSLMQGIVGGAFRRLEATELLANPERAGAIASVLSAWNLYGLAMMLAVAMVVELARRAARGEATGGLSDAPTLAVACALCHAVSPTGFAAVHVVQVFLLAGLVLGEATRGLCAIRVGYAGIATASATLAALSAAELRVREGTPNALNRVAFQPAETGLRAGWNPPEREHVWGAAELATVAFAMDRKVEGSAISVRLGTFGGDWVPLNPTRLLLNGRDVGTFLVYPGQFETIRTGAGGLLIGANALTFESAWARSPKSFGAGDDVRALSVAYHGLRLVSTRPSPQPTPPPSAP